MDALHLGCLCPGLQSSITQQGPGHSAYLSAAPLHLRCSSRKQACHTPLHPCSPPTHFTDPGGLQAELPAVPASQAARVSVPAEPQGQQ